MKALRTILATVVLLGGALTMNAQRMSIAAMRSNARFLTDRMAYTLGVNDPFLIDEMYRINFDYIYGVNDYLDEVALGYYYDDYMAVCNARDRALATLLGVGLWNRVVGYSYFYRPVVFANRGWRFAIYDHDRWGAHHFFHAAPRPYDGGYAGGHFFRGMAPRGGRTVHAAPGVAPGVNRRDGGHIVHRNPGAAPRGGHVDNGVRTPGGSVAPVERQNRREAVGGGAPQGGNTARPNVGNSSRGGGAGSTRGGAGARSGGGRR